MIEITQDEVMRNWNKNLSLDAPLVSVRCITYNHENYIAQALDSFIMQKTNFPFEIIVHDDASIDKTAEIIREYEKKYPLIVKPIYEEENQWSKPGNPLGKIVNAALNGKYVAICEGDDYWIDENKLQMQVDFLENNPEYGMCYTKAKQYNQSMQNFNKISVGADFDGFEDLLKNGNPIPALTTVYRKDLLDKYQKEIQPSNKGWLMGDYPMWLYFAHESKIKFFDKETAVYRVLEESASHSTDINKMIKFEESVYDIRQFYNQKFGLNLELKVNYSYISNRLIYKLSNNYEKKLAKDFRIVCKMQPFSLKNFVHYICSYSFILLYILGLLKKGIKLCKRN